MRRSPLADERENTMPTDPEAHGAEAVSSQKLEIRNATTAVLEVTVELYPDRYLLQPGDEMVIEADLSGAPFSIVPHNGGLQVYPGNDCGPPVKINGIPAESDWTTEI
jgi:hypothetical protein